jgi:hypothetical protein
MKIDNQDEYNLLYDFYIKQAFFGRLWVYIFVFHEYQNIYKL